MKDWTLFFRLRRIESRYLPPHFPTVAKINFDAKKLEKEILSMAKAAAVKHEANLTCPSCKSDMGSFVIGEVDSETVECPHCHETVKVNVTFSGFDSLG